MSKVLIYRPLGEHPPRTKMGDLELGRVHSISDSAAEPYLQKGFAILPDEAKSADGDGLAKLYATAQAKAATAPTSSAAPERAVMRGKVADTPVISEIQSEGGK